MNTPKDEPRNYIHVTGYNDRYAFAIHHDSSVLTRSAPLVSQYLYTSREEATAAAVRILAALMPPEKP